ncbi:BRCT domain-containing protein [Pseudomonadales bacterium]|nr:BRCT domain-containing protein [Pseudomonadales bacterium]
MEIFDRFNRKNIQDRQIDTLIGLSKGLLADGKVDQNEAEFLLSWLIQSKQSSNNPIILNLLDKVAFMLDDGVLDAEESSELQIILRTVSGESSEIGELSKTCSLPINRPAPPVHFEGSVFLCTGTFAFGSRKECNAVIEDRGGITVKQVTKSLDYLVLGTYVTNSWAHESFGRKIEAAMEYQEKGRPIAIVNEEHWANEAGI